jgi:RNA polymerase sigma-70 factor, ECF subfamily
MHGEPGRHPCGGPLGRDRSDEELMLAYQRGEVHAFEALMHRHRGPVFNFILRFTGDRARAEDLLQEAWLKVVRGASDYQPRARFTTWLYTLARNLCVDSSRKERYRKTESLDAPARGQEEGRTLAEALPDSRALPDREAHHARLRPLLEKVLGTLPAEQREVFCLREFAGIPFREIAEVTGASENTVKSRMRYALEALRRRLSELGVDGDWDAEERTAAG